MNLIDLVDNNRTDKNTVHSYLELYQTLLCGKKDTAKNVLEIGIFKGGSIKLWHDFFTNAHIYGIDIMEEKDVWNEIKKYGITLYTSTDAYKYILNELSDKKFDVILDDGPHTLESQLKCILLYSNVMTEDGILMIEDVQSWHWIELLSDAVPEHLKKYIKVYDLRENKGRYDDIVFTIDKS
jgi:hypothetical protein